MILLDAASEGLHVIEGMLVGGLIFLGVIVLGQLADAAGHRREARRRAKRNAY